MKQEDYCAVAYCIIFVGLASQTSILGATLLPLSEIYGEGITATANFNNRTVTTSRSTTAVGGAVALSESLMGRGIGYFLGTISIGTTFDKFPQQSHNILFISSFFVSLSTFLIPLYTVGFSQKYEDGSNVGVGRWLLFVALIFQGICAGAVDLGGNVLLTRNFCGDIERLSPRMNLLHCSWGIGATVGPAIALVLGLQKDSLAKTYGAISAIGSVLAIPVLFLKSPPVKSTFKVTGDLAVTATTSVEMVIDTKEQKRSTETLTSTSPTSIASPTSTTSRINRIIFFLLMYYFMYAGIEHIMGDWIATFGNIAPVNVTIETGALLISIYFGSMTVGRFISAIATSKSSWSRILTPSRLISFDLILALASYILLVFSGAYSLVPLVISVAGIGLAFSSIYPMGLALAETMIQPTGFQQSLFVGGAPLGGIIWPTVIGTLMREESAFYFTWSSFGLLILCIASFVAVNFHHAVIPNERTQTTVTTMDMRVGDDGGVESGGSNGDDANSFS
jgi:fucose permease